MYSNVSGNCNVDSNMDMNGYEWHHILDSMAHEFTYFFMIIIQLGEEFHLCCQGTGGLRVATCKYKSTHRVLGCGSVWTWYMSFQYRKHESTMDHPFFLNLSAMDCGPCLRDRSRQNQCWRMDPTCRSLRILPWFPSCLIPWFLYFC